MEARRRGNRYAESIRPFFENEDYLSDGNLLFEKYGEDAIPLIENALAEWKENQRLHPERVQAGAELTEQANNFEKQLRWTLAALKEIQYTAKRENEDFSKLAAQGAQMDSPAATARERLTSDNKFTAGVGLMLGDHRYAMMTEEERQLYNYLLAKEGEQSAQGYLKTIEDRLNARFGKAFHDTAENLENPLQRAGITAVTSVGAGLHDFGTGMHQSFTDEPVPRAPLQYAADLYSSELGGISKFAFDTGRTIGNMAPALAASAALGGLGARDRPRGGGLERDDRALLRGKLLPRGDRAGLSAGGGQTVRGDVGSFGVRHDLSALRYLEVRRETHRECGEGRKRAGDKRRAALCA